MANFTKQQYEDYVSGLKNDPGQRLGIDLESQLDDAGYFSDQAKMAFIHSMTGYEVNKISEVGPYHINRLTSFLERENRSTGLSAHLNSLVSAEAASVSPGGDSQAGHAASGNAIHPYSSGTSAKENKTLKNIAAKIDLSKHFPVSSAIDLSDQEKFIKLLSDNGVKASLDNGGKHLVIEDGKGSHRLPFDYASEKFDNGTSANFPIIGKQVYSWGAPLKNEQSRHGIPLLAVQSLEGPQSMALRHIKTALQSDDFSGTLRELQRPLRTLTEQPSYKDINNKALRMQLASSVLVYDSAGNTPAFKDKARIYGVNQGWLESQSSETGARGSSIFYRPDWLSAVSGVIPDKKADPNDPLGHLYGDKGFSVMKASTPEKPFKFAKTLKAREFYPVDKRFSGRDGVAGYNKSADGDSIIVGVGGKETGGGRAISSNSFYESVGLTAFRDIHLPIHGALDLKNLKLVDHGDPMNDETGSYRYIRGQGAFPVATIGDESFSISGSSFQGTVVKGNPRLSVGYGKEAVALMKSLGLGSESDLYRQMELGPTETALRDKSIEGLRDRLGIDVEFGGNNQGETSFVVSTARMVQGLGVKSDGSKAATSIDPRHSGILDTVGMSFTVAGSDIFKVPEPQRIIDGLLRTDDDRFSSLKEEYLNLAANDELEAKRHVVSKLQDKNFAIDFYKSGFMRVDGMSEQHAQSLAADAHANYGNPIPLAYSGHTVEYSASRHMGMPLDVFKGIDNAYPELSNEIQDHETSSGKINPYRQLVDSMTNAPAKEISKGPSGFGLNWQYGASEGTTRRALNDLSEQIGDENFSFHGVTMMSPKAAAYFGDTGLQSRYLDAITSGSVEEQQKSALKYQNYLIEKYADADEIKKGASSLQSLSGVFDRYVRGPENQDPNSIVIGKDMVSQLAKDTGISYKEMLKSIKAGEVHSAAVRIPLVGDSAPGIYKLDFNRRVSGYQVPASFEIAYQGDNDRDPAVMYLLGKNQNGKYAGFESAKKAYENFVAKGGSENQAMKALYAAGGKDGFESHVAMLKSMGFSGDDLRREMLYGNSAYNPSIGNASANPYIDSIEDQRKAPLGPIVNALNGDRSHVNKYEISRKFSDQATGKLEMGIYNFLRSLEEGGHDLKGEVDKAFPDFGSAVGSSASDMAAMNFRMVGYQPALDQSGLNAMLRDSFTKFNTETVRDPGSLSAQIFDTLRASGFQPETIASLAGTDAEDMRRIYDDLVAGKRPKINIDESNPSSILRASSAKIASNIETQTELKDGHYVNRAGKRIEKSQLENLKNIAGPRVMGAIRSINRRHYDAQEFIGGVDDQVSYSSGGRESGSQSIREIHSQNTAKLAAMSGEGAGEMPLQDFGDDFIGIDNAGGGNTTAAAAAPSPNSGGGDLGKSVASHVMYALRGAVDNGFHMDSATKMAMGGPYVAGAPGLSRMMAALFNKDGSPTGQNLSTLPEEFVKEAHADMGRYERSVVNRADSFLRGAMRPGEMEAFRRNLSQTWTRRDLDTQEGKALSETARSLMNKLPSAEEARENKYRDLRDGATKAFPEAMSEFTDIVKKAGETMKSYTELVDKARGSHEGATEVLEALQSNQAGLRDAGKFFQAVGLSPDSKNAAALNTIYKSAMSGHGELGKALMEQNAIGPGDQSSQNRVGRLMSGALMFQLARDLRYTVDPIANSATQGITRDIDNTARLAALGQSGDRAMDTRGYLAAANMQKAGNALDSHAQTLAGGYSAISGGVAGASSGILGAAYTVASPAVGATFATAMIGSALMQNNPTSSLGRFIGQAALPVGIAVAGINAASYLAGAYNDETGAVVAGAQASRRGLGGTISDVFTGRMPFNEFTAGVMRSMSEYSPGIAGTLEFLGGKPTRIGAQAFNLNKQLESPFKDYGGSNKALNVAASRPGTPTGDMAYQLGLSEDDARDSFAMSKYLFSGEGERSWGYQQMLNMKSQMIDVNSYLSTESSIEQGFGETGYKAAGDMLGSSTITPAMAESRRKKNANLQALGGFERIKAWTRMGKFSSLSESIKQMDELTYMDLSGGDRMMIEQEDRWFQAGSDAYSFGGFDSLNESYNSLVDETGGLEVDDSVLSGAIEARSLARDGAGALVSGGLFKNTKSAYASIQKRIGTIRGGSSRPMTDSQKLQLQQETGLYSRIPQLQSMGLLPKDNDAAMKQIQSAFSGGPLSSMQMATMERFMAGDPFVVSKAATEYYQSGGTQGALMGPGGGAGGSGLLMDSNNGRGRFDVSSAALNDRTAAMPLMDRMGPSGAMYKQPYGQAFRNEIRQDMMRNSTMMSRGSINTWKAVGTGFQNRMVSAESGESFGIGGIGGLNILSSQVSYEATAAQAGLAIAELKANRDFQLRVARPQAHMKFDMDVSSWYGGTVDTKTKDLKTGENIVIDYGRGEKERRRAQISLQRQGDLAGFGQSMARLNWQMEDVGREQSRYGVQVGWQREDFDLQSRRMGAQRSFQAYEQSFALQGIALNRRYANEDFAYGRMMNQRNFSFSMQDYDTNIRRASGFERRQLVKQRDRDVETFQLETNQQDKLKKRQEEQFQREESHLKKSIEYTKQMQKLEDEEFRKKKSRFEVEVGWREEDFGIRRGRISQEMKWAEENFARSEAARNLQLETMESEEKQKEALMSMEKTRMTEQEKLEDKLYALSVARAGVAAGEAAKQLEIQKRIEGLKEKQEAAIKAFEVWSDNAAYVFVRALFKYIGEQMPGMPSSGGSGDSGSNKRVGGEIKETEFIRENNSSGSKNEKPIIINIDGKKVAEATFGHTVDIAERSMRRSTRR